MGAKDEPILRPPIWVKITIIEYDIVMNAKYIRDTHETPKNI